VKCVLTATSASAISVLAPLRSEEVPGRQVRERCPELQLRKSDGLTESIDAFIMLGAQVVRTRGHLPEPLDCFHGGYEIVEYVVLRLIIGRADS
jgi:hypothetical protein